MTEAIGLSLIVIGFILPFVCDVIDGFGERDRSNWP